MKFVKLHPSIPCLIFGNFMTPLEYPNNNGSVVVEVFKIQDGLIRIYSRIFPRERAAPLGIGRRPRQLIAAYIAPDMEKSRLAQGKSSCQ